MTPNSITQICRELRLRETPAEKKLWAKLRNRKIVLFKFRRQHPFIYSSIQGSKKFFVADFYCKESRLIIELDGRIHDFQKDYDANRDWVLAQMGLCTIRIKNEELDSNMENVMENILAKLEERRKIPPLPPDKRKLIDTAY